MHGKEFLVKLTLHNVGTTPISQGSLSYQIMWAQFSPPMGVGTDFSINFPEIPPGGEHVAKAKIQAALPGPAILRIAKATSAQLVDPGIHIFLINESEHILSGYHNLVALTVAIATLIITVAIAYYPLWTASPNIEFEIDPSLGRIEGSNTYLTTIRNLERPMKVVFTVRIHNTGTAVAHNVLVQMSQTPQREAWYDFEEAYVYPPATRPYRTDSNSATIFILKTGESAEIDFNIAFFAPDFDKINQEGERPMIHFVIDRRGLPTPIHRDYLVKIP
jgi:hypothetical protein